ncbi:TetR/AcrR family transcriptional regulator [Roseateles sp. SL47]|jgi:AcrR family transcriptional regulator|uniref:TetR/AcrR family transcriptional regulator n=1 Tax=Roseateles sp. SL47 TaxID=2995138 RepID=UPI002270EEC7|nr:TetR/AcrR family transcriptional regulator [Roseateles sp. SL47]WAC72124.1 TetR/AcrR family transcriptional regulator [Roseateles sp. SL47]
MSSPSKEPIALRQRRKEARPQELLDAALALFVEKGFAATRSEEVAARAGVSKGTLYLYYPSKEELFKAVIRESLGSKIAEGREGLDKHQGPMADLLVWLMREWWMRLGLTPAGGIMKIMLAEARNFPDIAAFYVDEVIDPSCNMLAEVVRRGVASGEFRPVDPDTAVHVLIGPILHMVLHQYSIGACGLDLGPKKQPEAVIELHMELLFKGLLNRPRDDGMPRVDA